jgi:hypothetical protein
VKVNKLLNINLKPSFGRLKSLIFYMFLFIVAACDSSGEAETSTSNIKQAKSNINSVTPNGYLSFYIAEQELSITTNHASTCTYQDVAIAEIEYFSQNLVYTHKTTVLVYPQTEYTYKITCSYIDSGVDYEEIKYTSFQTATSDTDIPIVIKLLVSKNNRNKLSIFGYNFGVKIQAYPLIFDKFEDGENTKILAGSWTLFRNNNKGPFYTTEESYSGSLSVKNTVFSKSGTEFNSAWKEFVSSEEVYLSYRFLFKINEETDKGVMKLARITSNYQGKLKHHTHYNGPGDTTLQYQPSGSKIGWLYTSYNIGQNVWQGTIPSKSLIHNEWNRIEIYKKLSGPFVVDGKYSVKINNTTILNKVDVLTRGAGFDFQQSSILLPLMYANPRPESKITMYVDDIYINSTTKRVELANCPNYEQCTIREIQEIVSWERNKLDIILTYEKLSKYDDVYLFVIDANGVVSEGNLIEQY